MEIRELVRQSKRELRCHRKVADAQVTNSISMRQAANRALNRDQCSALLQWLTRQGPFWDDVRQHGGDDWLECNGDIVTETAVGEAAYCIFHDIACSIVSMDPSSWTFSPVMVDWRKNGLVQSGDIPNYWKTEDVRTVLDKISDPLDSWESLESTAKEDCPYLTFSSNTFEPLRKHPFNQGAANGLLSRLKVLHNLKNCFDEHGQRTPKGNQIYQNHFTGDNAWFSDSSASEKRDFDTRLSFPHPEMDGEILSCTWHGKVRSRQSLRLHFSWPVQAHKPLYVVYVGPKITKQ